jgi:hypothetical protein
VTAAVFILLPITPASVLIFSAVMGALWLATVPLTSGLVAHIYGIRYMGTLYGFRVPQPPDRRVPGGLAGRQDV